MPSDCWRLKLPRRRAANNQSIVAWIREAGDRSLILIVDYFPISDAPASRATFRTRIASGEDVSRMIPVVNAAFAVETFLDGSRTDDDHIAEMMETGEFLLAEDSAGRILACVYVENRGERGYFGMLAVDPSAQGRGLGRDMVEAAENHCRRQGCGFMDITVLSLRVDLPPFYRKLGYVETATKGFETSRRLQDGLECHCIVMSKAL